MVKIDYIKVHIAALQLLFDFYIDITDQVNYLQLLADNDIGASLIPTQYPVSMCKGKLILQNSKSS